MRICKWIAALTAAGVLLAGCADPGQPEPSYILYLDENGGAYLPQFARINR